MPIKKSELYSSLWQSCDELRGGMDASQYKDYVLVLLFMKYVSDKAMSQKGYLLDVPKGGSFADMVALKGDKEIGDKINKIIARLAEANDLKGVIDVADFNDADKLGKGQDMVARLTALVSIFQGLDFGQNRAEGDDLLGDAYEYLMRHFATDSGKSKGQFYTPAEVSRIMAKVIGIGSATSASQTIYDPTCGSGSLLLKAHDEAKGVSGTDLTLYGQEMDNATKALARMNMILHDCETADIWQDNTLSTPHFKDAKTGQLKTFDFAVANPPFSTKAWSTGFDPANDLFHRFAYGIPPQKNGDYAFLLHILASLKSHGKGAIILPHGVLFRGGAEAAIRREVVQRGYIKAIIGLPANLFYGTGIPACIIVLDKENANARKGVYMIDAAKAFIKDGNKNRLRARDIHKIVDAFTRLVEIPRYSRMVSLAEIKDAKNNFNLNLPRYIDSTEPEDLQDIDGHLRGGIPTRDIDALKNFWDVFPSIRKSLFVETETSASAFAKGMNPAYFETRFERLEKWTETPVEFAIITAYATTGEKWSEATNRAADKELEADLRKQGRWVRRLTGYSPSKGHREPGWAVDLGLTAACDIGLRYKQDAIYYIAGDTLNVSFCDSRRAPVKVGTFSTYVHTADSNFLPRPGYSQLRVPIGEVKAAIIGHAEFTTYNESATKLFAKWKTFNTPHLRGIAKGGKPKALIETFSEDLLATFEKARLLDAYDVYQHLMDYWAETMQDDVYMIVSGGWREAAKPRLIVEDKNKKIKEKPDFTVGKLKYKAELIPTALVVARYFAAEQAAIETLEAEIAATEQAIEEMAEEHGGEEGLLFEAQNEKGILTKASVKARLDAAEEGGADVAARGEIPRLKEYLRLIEKASVTGAKVRDAKEALLLKVAAQYGKLTEDEIKTLVVDDKWLARLSAAVQGELDRVSQTLTGRIRQLAERYVTTLPQLAVEVATLTARVEGHLKKMGAVWK